MVRKQVLTLSNAAVLSLLLSDRRCTRHDRYGGQACEDRTEDGGTVRTGLASSDLWPMSGTIRCSTSGDRVRVGGTDPAAGAGDKDYQAVEYELNSVERRVLGVLIEKALSQPDYYPMTVNAVVVACNQKNNRDPVMELDEATVDATLEALRRRGLTQLVLPAPGARTKRYKHLASTVFVWSPKDAAVMAELLLRGPQTVGELRTHCSRLVPFESLEIVSNVLGDLASRTPPLVAALPREPGRSAVRYRHLLYPPGEEPVVAAGPQEEAASMATTSGGAESLKSTVSRLETEVSQLRSQVEEIARRLASLETALGESPGAG